MSDNIHYLPGSLTHTVEQAIASAGNVVLKEVIVVGVDSDNELFIRSSGMTRRDALWLAEQLKIHILGVS